MRELAFGLEEVDQWLKHCSRGRSYFMFLIKTLGECGRAEGRKGGGAEEREGERREGVRE